MPYCAECGAYIKDDSFFCDKCGTALSKKSPINENIVLIITWKNEMKKSVRFTVEFNDLEISQIGQGETIRVNASKGINKIRFIPKAPKWFGWKTLTLKLDLGQSPNIMLAIGSLAGNITGGTWQLHAAAVSDAAILEQQHA